MLKRIHGSGCSGFRSKLFEKPRIADLEFRTGDTFEMVKRSDRDLTGPDRLRDVTKLAAALPSLRIVIDHCANVRLDGAAPPAAWREGLRACAPHRNVFMKVSGLVEGTGRADGKAPADAAFYQPTLDAIWDTFGEARVLFGSNWPVSARFAGYATLLGIVTDYFATKGRAAAENYFSRNAVKVYKVGRR